MFGGNLWLKRVAGKCKRAASPGRAGCLNALNYAGCCVPRIAMGWKIGNGHTQEMILLQGVLRKTWCGKGLGLPQCHVDLGSRSKVVSGLEGASTPY